MIGNSFLSGKAYRGSNVWSIFWKPTLDTVLKGIISLAMQWQTGVVFSTLLNSVTMAGLSRRNPLSLADPNL